LARLLRTAVSVGPKVFTVVTVGRGTANVDGVQYSSLSPFYDCGTVRVAQYSRTLGDEISSRT
jgi:hypothetical protein